MQSCRELWFEGLGRVLKGGMMAKRSIMSDGDLLKGAEAIAAAMQGPAGRRLKLAKVIDDHIDWFHQARRRGLEWGDIVALLFRAGATRSDGRPLLRGHVQSLVWRKQHAERQAGKKLAARREAPTTMPEAVPSAGPSMYSEPVRGGRKRHPAKQGHAAPVADLSRQPERVAVPIGKPDVPPEGNALLAYMKRAARLRRDE